MTAPTPITAKDPRDFPNWGFDHLAIDYHAPTQSVWMNYRADAPLCYTPHTLHEMMIVRESLRALFAAGLTAQYPVRYFVIASHKPGVFNLGGDLVTFATAIRAHDVDALRDYAHACVDLIDSLLQGLGLPIVTVSAVHGQCLGGAFEAALATDFILAEESARFGVPEVAFNTFPGMGAVSLLTRKLGGALAQKIISEGRVYSGREMYDLEAIDNLAPDGEIRETTRSWMLNDAETNWARRRALAEARRRCNLVTRDELIHIANLWADCSTRIDDVDLRHMERLVGAQKRLFGAARAKKLSAGAPPTVAANS